MRKTCDFRRLPSGNSIQAPVPKSTWASSPAVALHPAKRQTVVSLAAWPRTAARCGTRGRTPRQPGPGRSAGPKAPAPTSPGSPADTARRRCDRPPSPRKLPPSKRSIPATKSGGDSAGSSSARNRSEPRGALAGFDCSEPRGALAGFELAGWYVRQGGRLARLDPPLFLEGSATRGLPGPPAACSASPPEPRGALAGFGPQLAARMYFATVSRSTSNSRAIRRCGQPCSCNFKIA